MKSAKNKSNLRNNRGLRFGVGGGTEDVVFELAGPVVEDDDGRAWELKVSWGIEVCILFPGGDWATFSGGIADAELGVAGEYVVEPGDILLTEPGGGGTELEVVELADPESLASKRGLMVSKNLLY